MSDEADCDWKWHAITWLARRAEKFRATGGGDALDAAIVCEDLIEELEAPFEDAVPRKPKGARFEFGGPTWKAGWAWCARCTKLFDPASPCPGCGNTAEDSPVVVSRVQDETILEHKAGPFIGRMTSSKPNVQSIPRKPEDRPWNGPEDGDLWHEGEDE